MRNKKYSRYFICFDIETSKLTLQDGSNFQMMYLGCVKVYDSHQPTLENNKYKEVEKFYVRTEKELIELFRSKSIIKYVDGCEKILTFAHNLDYELTFILRELPVSAIKQTNKKYNQRGKETQDFVARNSHSPLRVVLETLEHIEFRCTYAVSNKSIKAIGKEKKVEKLEYQYDMIRLPIHKLEVLDYLYVERDVDLSAFIVYDTIEQGFTLENFPLTFTSITVSRRSRFIDKYFTDEKKLCINKLKYSFLDCEFYLFCNDAFYGGTTTCNPLICNQLLEHVWSCDIKSSYPYIAVYFKFPYFSKKATKHYLGIMADDLYHEKLDGIKYDCLNKEIKGYIGEFTFYNVTLKTEQLPPTISISKSDSKISYNDFNGKLLNAEQITFTMTNVGLDCFNEIYDYDGLYCSELYTTSDSRYLPLGEIEFIIDAFSKKETLEKDNPLRPLAKQDVNSMFGVKVQKPIKNLNVLENGEIRTIDYYADINNEELDITDSELIKIYNERTKEIREKSFETSRWDIFSDGLFFTDVARYRLISTMKLLNKQGFNVSYTDTDSIHCYVENINDCEVEKYSNLLQNTLEKLNNQVINRNKNSSFFKFYRDKINPLLTDEEYEKICKLGIVEIETYETHEYLIDGEWKRKQTKTVKPYKEKTLGAKKYGNLTEIIRHHENGETETYLTLNTTVAGCSKLINETITKLSKENNIELDKFFDLVFSPQTSFDKSCSGRTTAERETRDRNWLKEQTYEYNGEMYQVNSNGGLVINDTTYFLNLKESDMNYLGLTYGTESKIIISQNHFMINDN